ncbi:MAG: hypothetical protein AAGA84_06735, partial [Pseudomonadota bacterium]
VVAPLLSDYGVPTLLLHSEEDELVPPSHSETIAAASDEVISLNVIANAGSHEVFPALLPLRCREIMTWLSIKLDDVNLRKTCDDIDVTDPDGLMSQFGTGEPKK